MQLKKLHPFFLWVTDEPPAVPLWLDIDKGKILCGGLPEVLAGNEIKVGIRSAGLRDVGFWFYFF